MTTALPALLPWPDIHRRLQEIFPEGTPHRDKCVWEIAARTVFVMLYAGAVGDRDVWSRPDQVTRMRDTGGRRWRQSLSRRRQRLTANGAGDLGGVMTKTDFALPDWVDVGATFYERTCDADGSRTDKWHVRAIVYGRAVCRRWTKGHGGSWHYEIKSAVFFSVFGGQYDLRTGADLSTD